MSAQSKSENSMISDSQYAIVTRVHINAMFIQIQRIPCGIEVAFRIPENSRNIACEAKHNLTTLLECLVGRLRRFSIRLNIFFICFVIFTN